MRKNYITLSEKDGSFLEVSAANFLQGLGNNSDSTKNKKPVGISFRWKPKKAKPVVTKKRSCCGR